MIAWIKGLFFFSYKDLAKIIKDNPYISSTQIKTILKEKGIYISVKRFKLLLEICLKLGLCRELYNYYEDIKHTVYVDTQTYTREKIERRKSENKKT